MTKINILALSPEGLRSFLEQDLAQGVHSSESPHCLS